jgi:hypothetical protein
MKKHIVVLFCLVFLYGNLSAAEITLVNKEDHLLYFLMVNENSVDFDAVDEPNFDYKSYLQKQRTELDYIPGNSAFPITNVHDEKIYIIGFYAEPGAPFYPLVSILIPAVYEDAAFAVSSENTVKKEETELAFSSWKAPLPKKPILLDNLYLDWVSVPDLAVFSSDYMPAMITRKSNGAETAMKPADSFFWNKGGTSIEKVKMLRTTDYLYLNVSTFSGIKDGLSFFFYVFEDRSIQNANTYTIEIPLGAGGTIVLWEAGKKEPVIVGECVNGNFLLEGRIALRRLPAVLEKFRNDSFSMDFSSCFFDAGIYEEFGFTSFSLRDIPTK